jgi:hypothetical protein
MDGERAGEWLTYKEAAARLGSTAEAIRYRAIRGRWPRMRANDGRAKIQIPDDPNPVRTPSAPRANGGSDTSLAHALESHINTLRGENDVLKQQLATVEIRLLAADARTAAADARSDAADAALLEERARAGQALAAFAALADRLDELAMERARPWWRRLVG